MIIFAYQSEFGQERVTIRPRGLLPDTTYAVRSIDTGPLGITRGDALMEGGIELSAGAKSRSHVLILRALEP